VRASRGRATAAVTVAVLFLALFTPMDVLAEATSGVMLAVFFVVNLSLLRLKLAGAAPRIGVRRAGHRSACRRVDLPCASGGHPRPRRLSGAPAGTALTAINAAPGRQPTVKP